MLYIYWFSVLINITKMSVFNELSPPFPLQDKIIDTILQRQKNQPGAPTDPQTLNLIIFPYEGTVTCMCINRTVDRGPQTVDQDGVIYYTQDLNKDNLNATICRPARPTTPAGPGPVKTNGDLWNSYIYLHRNLYQTNNLPFLYVVTYKIQ